MRKIYFFKYLFVSRTWFIIGLNSKISIRHLLLVQTINSFESPSTCKCPILFSAAVFKRSHRAKNSARLFVPWPAGYFKEINWEDSRKRIVPASHTPGVPWHALSKNPRLQQNLWQVHLGFFGLYLYLARSLHKTSYKRVNIL